VVSKFAKWALKSTRSGRLGSITTVVSIGALEFRELMLQSFVLLGIGASLRLGAASYGVVDESASRWLGKAGILKRLAGVWQRDAFAARRIGHS
jgi:hypothetical protein